MSEGLEDVSVDVVAPVAETAAPVGGADTVVVPVDVDPSVSVPEQPDSDQRVFDNSPRIGSSEDNIRQDIAAENNMALGNGGGESRAPVTARGQEEAENKKQEARSALIEQLEQQAEDAAKRREEWLKQDHDFGGMKMSGHDLEKLLNFISNPQMQDQLRERLGKKGVPKEKAEKGMKELQEYVDLKKKEAEGKLTVEEQRRLREINKSEEFKVVAQEAARTAQEYGVKISPVMAEAQAKIRANTEDNNVQIADAGIEAVSVQLGVQVVQLDQKEEDVGYSAENESDDTPKAATKVAFVSATARENFPTAPAMMKEFAASSTGNVVALTSTANLSMGAQGMDIESDDAMSPVAAVSIAQKMPLQPSARA